MKLAMERRDLAKFMFPSFVSYRNVYILSVFALSTIPLGSLDSWRRQLLKVK